VQVLGVGLGTGGVDEGGEDKVAEDFVAELAGEGEEGTWLRHDKIGEMEVLCNWRFWG